MASDNEEALRGHVTEVEPNHWTVTVSHDSLLAWNSIMAQININPGGFPLSRIWHIWISATEWEQASVERIQSLSEQWHVCRSDIHLQRNNPRMKQTATAATKPNKRPENFPAREQGWSSKAMKTDPTNNTHTFWEEKIQSDSCPPHPSSCFEISVLGII